MRGSTKILWIGLVAVAAAGGFVVHRVAGHRQARPGDGQRAIPSGQPGAGHDAAPPAVPAVPPTPAVAGSPAAPVDPTKVDRLLQGSFTVEYTAEQEARLQAVRKEFGELEARVAVAEREINDVRAMSAGLPGVRERVEDLKSARAALDAYARGLPSRANAEIAVRTAAAHDGQCRKRLRDFQAHLAEHLKKPATELPEDCEWCRRDAALIASRDSRLGRTYNDEGERLMVEAQSAADAHQKSRIELAGALRSAAATDEGRELAARVTAAQKALDEAMASLPDVDRWRSEADKARVRQKVLADEMMSIREAARRVTPSVAKNGGSDKDGDARGP